MIRSILLLVIYVSYIQCDDCTKNQKWCPITKTPISCYLNQTNVPITYSEINALALYSNWWRQKDACQRLNNDTKKLQIEGYMRTSAVKTFRLNLVNHNQACYTTDLHRNVAEIHYHSATKSPVDEFTRKLRDHDDERALIAFVMKSNYIGCANNATDILCLVSYDDEPFKKFNKFAVNANRYCNVNYVEPNLDVCYLQNTTIENIVAELQKHKILEWDIELEYLAQAAVIFNKTNACYSDKWLSIDYNFEKITRYNITELVQHLLSNQVFDGLENSVNYSIGCAVYVMKPNSFRFFCLYGKSESMSPPIYIIETNLNVRVHYTVYIIYGLIALVTINIVIVSIYMNILWKFKATRRKKYICHNCGNIEISDVQ